MSLVVGSVAYDGVETPHGKVDRIARRSRNYIALSASYFTQPKVVAVVGEDFAADEVPVMLNRDRLHRALLEKPDFVDICADGEQAPTYCILLHAEYFKRLAPSQDKYPNAEDANIVHHPSLCEAFARHHVPNAGR